MVDYQASPSWENLEVSKLTQGTIQSLSAKSDALSNSGCIWLVSAY